MKSSNSDNPHRFDNMSKTEADNLRAKAKSVHKTEAFSKKMKEVANKRYFREKNPDISALMELYNSGDEKEVMNKYVTDVEVFKELFENADTVESRRRIWSDYMSFNLKIFELMFGTKSKIDQKVQSVNYNVVIHEPK